MEKIKELRAKSTAELQEMEASLKKEALNLRFQQASGQLKNTARRRQIRRTVAKIKTVVAEQAAKKSA
ncbi:MAG: 50S ribosomal protein L29 [Alphaproteobacteria bacterium]|jgi:large subunit ribosomal protein L29|nr:50S ribosomal protein L29 [Alphaproteobacteria bacterium]MBQ9738561.1 50S ribosomal protein L29 [Alphaproteobacteria bacterium]MBR4115228.1 50S ribosomal protein L29 [Bacteroidales bacterium]MBR5129802.1 50S ribosomal protein L29 [Alphaproteobacteria bacterium]MBR6675470.1 50S ribosomal protein L29 [Alphaproteobacteria bacterium]